MSQNLIFPIYKYIIFLWRISGSNKNLFIKIVKNGFE